MGKTFLNIVEFGMDSQQAVEEPRVVSLSHPDSGWPHPYQPATVRAEGRIPDDTLAELERRGHKIQRQADFMQMGGALCVITVDHERGLLVGGADPRLESAAVGR
ncbi:MAG: gamma-glutamyltransferase, partial [Chloroflexi bacterium]|nr:gamma-glutamyltransferase [Chloroflexota bacterium]